MTKIRVHELAKEFGVPSKEMEARIRDLGYNIKNYMSTLEDYEAQEIRKKLRGQMEQEKAEPEQQPRPKKVVRRRHQVIRIKKIVRKRPAAVEEPRKEAEQRPLKAPKEPVKGEVLKERPAERPLAKELAPEIPREKEEKRPEKLEAKTPEIEKREEIKPPEAPEAGTGVKKVQLPEVEAPKEGPQRPQEKIEAKEERKITEKKEKRPEKKVSVPSVKKAKEEKPALAPKKKEEAKKEPEERAKPTPKSFVKILDRPRIEIPIAPQKPPKEPVSKKAEVSKPIEEKVAGKAPIPSETTPPAPEKKSKKKGKRVVQMAEMRKAARKKKPASKRKEKQKPITKILAEEVVDLSAEEFQPEEVTQAPSVTPTKKKKKGAKAAAEQPPPHPPTAPPKAGKRKLTIYETIQVGELAKRMGVKVSEVIMKLMALGIMATANQTIDFDAAALVASEFDWEVERKPVAEDLIHEIQEVEGGELVPRPPVVTVMGHVDHGKTSLLDAIRQADVVSHEAGGITQHIGAYQVKLPSGNLVTFLDTPGHEAFTAMRARGAQVTDIVILVVAADDGVMAQTREAIDHARAAGVPIIVAVNKIDKPGANPDRVRNELAELGLIPEDWGGDTIFVNVSAKKKIGIEELLEMLILQAEVMELKADPKRPARGHVIEAKLDKGRGPVATLLVSEGTLHVGDALVCGLYAGRVRAMLNERGERLESAGPATPVEVQGLSGVPSAGDEFLVLPDEKKAREIAEYRQRKQREAELAKSTKITLESVFEKLKEGEVKELNIVLKTDVQGSLEALSDALQKLSTKDVRVNIVRSSIGAITESDVLLASASNAIIIGFNVRPTHQAKELAEQEHVEIRFYDVIYNALDDVKAAMVGMLEPVYKEKVIGQAEVRATFRISKVGTVAGCYVTSGVIQRNANARLLRDNVVVYTGKIASLRRFKEDVKEVQSGYECGIGLEKFNDIKEGDVIEAYVMEEVTPELGQTLAETAEHNSQNDKDQ